MWETSLSTIYFSMDLAQLLKLLVFKSLMCIGAANRDFTEIIKVKLRSLEWT